jgi:hypothetical protein
MKVSKAMFASLAQSRVARGLAAGASALAVGSAHAVPTTIDTTEVVGTITAGVTTISAIGVAVLSLVVVIKLFKWVQRTL